jgi:hypothetical protein
MAVLPCRRRPGSRPSPARPTPTQAMQEPATAPTLNEDLEDSASALLEAIVRAEVELNALEERCGSLELAISLGREAVTTAESLPPANGSAKGSSGNVAPPERSSSEGMPAATGPAEAPLPQPIRAPRPLTIRPQGAAKPEPTPAPVAASADAPATEKPNLEPAVNPELAPAAEKLDSDPVSRSLEEQAAALRAAMGEDHAPVAEEASAKVAVGPAPVEQTAPVRPPAPTATKREPGSSEQGPFKPKRSTPLKSRLAGLDVNAVEREGESYSDRSAELEQLLRSRDDS